MAHLKRLALSFQYAAPKSYSITDVSRPGHRGDAAVGHGGTAVFHHSICASCTIMLSLRTTLFELRVYLMNTKISKFILNTIYRPSDYNIAEILFLKTHESFRKNLYLPH